MLPASKHIFGIHSVTPYQLTDGMPYGIIKVLSGASLELTGELVKLNGGSYAYSWAVEDGYKSGTLNFKPQQYEEFMFELFLGKAPTKSGTGSGSVTTLTNFNGTSVSDASTGIASIGVLSGSSSNLKAGKYMVKAVDATTVDLYNLTDFDFSRGTDTTYVDETLKITSAALTVSDSGATTDVADFGLQITGGSGVVALTADDTAYFEVKPPASSDYVVKLGAASDRTPEFGAYLTTEPRGNGESFAIDCYRCRAIGMPFNFEAKNFSEAEIKSEVLYDSSEDAVCQVRWIRPTSPV